MVNSQLALWLFQKFGLSLAAAGTLFFCLGPLSAGSRLAAPKLPKRIGLANTMVFTHIPASLCLFAAAFSTNVWVAGSAAGTRIGLVHGCACPKRICHVSSPAA